jgi:hypothetical protein
MATMAKMTAVVDVAISAGFRRPGSVTVALDLLFRKGLQVSRFGGIVRGG